MSRLPRYAEYRDSGVEWLGQVPAHWRMGRIKHVFEETEERSGDGTGTLLSLTRARGLIRQSDASSKAPSASDLSKYKVCQPGQLVMNRMQAWSGMFGVPTEVGLVSPDYSVFRAKRVSDVTYFLNLFKTPHYVEQFAQRSQGVGTGFNRLYFPDFGAIPVALFPVEEQAAIVRYLDALDRRVNRLLRIKRRLIVLLNEQKQAIIHRAVTKGLNPDALMKPSGIDWLGEIPAHWTLCPAKYFFREVDERSTSGDEELLSVSHITGVTPRSQKNITMFMAESYVGHKLCRPGDLVINTMWAWMGALGVSQKTGIVSSSYGVYRPSNTLASIPEYLDLLLRTKPYISEYTCRSTGVRASRLRLYPDKFLSIPLVQPDIEEQRGIIGFIAQELKDINTGVNRIQQEIELIREYRTRLIADVVTGKLDVRDAILPDAFPDSEVLAQIPLDEADALDERDDDTEDIAEDADE